VAQHISWNAFNPAAAISKILRFLKRKTAPKMSD
jgi:hypothetical protein